MLLKSSTISLITSPLSRHQYRLSVTGPINHYDKRPAARAWLILCAKCFHYVGRSANVLQAACLHRCERDIASSCTLVCAVSDYCHDHGQANIKSHRRIQTT